MEFKAFVSSFIDALFPPKCIFCGKVRVLNNGVCSSCAQTVNVIPFPVCLKCAKHKKDCDCKKREHFFDGVCGVYYYSGEVKKGLYNLKFNGDTACIPYYGKMMAQRVKDAFGDIRFDFVTNVPMTYKSFVKRGYNQSALLARVVADELGVKYDGEIIAKIYKTETQHLLESYYLRSGNLTGVFDVISPEKVKGKNILLVDDILTSGATLDECAKMLYLEEADSVFCSVFAVTPSQKKDNKDNENQ